MKDPKLNTYRVEVSAKVVKEEQFSTETVARHSVVVNVPEDRVTESLFGRIRDVGEEINTQWLDVLDRLLAFRGEPEKVD